MDHGVVDQLAAIAVSFVVVESLVYLACLATLRLPPSARPMRFVIAYARWDRRFDVHALFVWLLCALGTNLVLNGGV
jgi:hypothetical protein